MKEILMSTPNEHLVARFLLTSLPKSLSAAYHTLATLKYPIPDKQSLAVQLEELGSANQDSAKTHMTSNDLIRGSLSVFDFPIETPQSALEKFDARVSTPRGGNFPDLGSEKSKEGFSAAEIFQRDFSQSCAAFALQAYHANLERGEFAALSAGLMQGRWCQDNFGSLAGPCFDVALRAYFEALRRDSTEPLALAAGREAGLRCSSFPIPHVPPPGP